MLIQQIRQWLDNYQDFAEGLELLKQSNHNPSLCYILKKIGATKFNQQKLIDELSNILTHHIASAETEPVNGVEYDFFSLPEELQKEHFRKSTLYKEAGKLHQALCNNPSEEEAAKLTEGIMRLMQENQQIWEKLDYFKAHGVTKKQTNTVIPDIIGLSQVELLRFRSNNAANLSKWKKKLAKLPDGDKKSQLQTRYQEHVKLQEQANKLINEFI